MENETPTTESEPPPETSSSERTPLIPPPSTQPPQPAPVVQARLSGNSSTGLSSSTEQRRPIIAVAPVNSDEQPVPTPMVSAVGGVPTINCRICRSLISLESKLANHVVKCPTCNEATPIRAAPEGKRYVRCPCGCLLVCKQSASRISCPRDHCRRVLNLTVSTSSAEADSATRTGPGGGQYGATVGPANLVVSHLQCPSCSLSFLLQSDPSTNTANCPHCGARCVLHRSYARNRLLACLLLSLLFVGGAVATLLLTWDKTFNNGQYAIIAAWASLFLLALVCASGALYFGLMKVAKVMTSGTSSYAPLNGSGRYAYA